MLSHSWHGRWLVPALAMPWQHQYRELHQPKIKLQLNLAISNLDNSKSPLFRSRADSPSLDSLGANSVISNLFSCPKGLRNSGIRLCFEIPEIKELPHVMVSSRRFLLDSVSLLVLGEEVYATKVQILLQFLKFVCFSSISPDKRLGESPPLLSTDPAPSPSFGK